MASLRTYNVHPLSEKQWVFGLALILSSAFNTGCAGPPPPVPQYSYTESCNSNKAASGYGLLQSPIGTDEDRREDQDDKRDKTPTFEDDILPLLSSTDDGRVYKCTVCHSRYTDPANVATTTSTQQIIASIKPGGTMPLNADRVKSEDIRLLEQWMAAGFPLTEDDVKDKEAEEESKTPQETAKEQWGSGNRKPAENQPSRGTGQCAPKAGQS